MQEEKSQLGWRDEEKTLGDGFCLSRTISALNMSMCAYIQYVYMCVCVHIYRYILYIYL